MKKTTRREALKNITVGSVALGSTSLFSSFSNQKMDTTGAPLKSNINHSVCWWTYNFIPLEELCKQVKSIGFSAIDLVGPKEWPTLKAHGIFSSMCNGAEINLTEGWNDKKNHAKLIDNYKEHIDLVQKAGYKNLICFSGNRNGMDEETGFKNCIEGLKQILGQAEKKRVIIQMELLNSKVDHKDQMCDNSKWGVELVKRIGSPNFKLLYDIYHMQIDEGDVIRTIRNNHQYFGHYHTGGVPGRHLIDETQELYYPAILKAIHETGFSDYVAQEFIPTDDDNNNRIAQLKKAVMICDI